MYESLPLPTPGLRASGARAPPTGGRGAYFQIRSRLISRAFPPRRGRSPVTRVTSEPRPNLSRPLGPSTDWPVYTHILRPTKEKGHLVSGHKGGGTVSLRVRRDKPKRPSIRATQGALKFNPLPRCQIAPAGRGRTCAVAVKLGLCPKLMSSEE